ncbi:MAG: light-regulated signal transduction histidine kinase (bacteriophytochrome), partial [Nitrospinales bacterium]
DQFNATTWRILIINGVTIFLMFIAGVFFVQNISRPIISLSKAANDISVGKYSGKNIPSKMRDDEIGILNKSFIKMAENIRQHNLEREHLIKKIAQLNDDLSGRIIELNHANKDMDSFTYSVAHDLREPLRSINGFGKLILKNHADKLDEKGMDYFNRMSSSAQKMGNLIEALLALSRQTRKISQAVSIDLTAMTHEILAGLVDHPLPYGMKIIVADGMRLNGDKELIKVVLTNLLSNALKYTSKRTDVVIEVGVQIQEGKTVYFIRDNGVGFESEYSNKLFLPFQRLHSTQDYEGAGIGLATVERIIDRHGGRVWAEGAVDQGATFYFSI